MRLTNDVAADLFHRGEFLELIEKSGRDFKERSILEPGHRAILATALAIVSRTHEAIELAELDRVPPSRANTRSQAESAMAMAHWRIGDAPTAIRHAQAALHLGQESGDHQRTAWAHLQLFRMLIESGDLSKVVAALPDVRRTVSRAGVPQATAYLHSCVAVLEGQTGRLDEARRHTHIAESFLQRSPNIHLTATSLQNLGCMAVISGDFATATELLKTAKQMTRRSGDVQTAIVAAVNLGHVQLLTGDFSKAKATFDSIIEDESIKTITKLAAAGGLARLHLALGELDNCERALGLISGHVRERQELAYLFHVRWDAPTQARVLLRRGCLVEAIEWLSLSERRYQSLGDLPLNATLHLIHAEVAAKTGDLSGAAGRIICANELDITQSSELQAHYYYTGALILENLSPVIAAHMKQRADRIWAAQHIVSPRMEMGECCSGAIATAERASGYPSDEHVACVTSSLASFGDLAHRPRLLADEIVAVLRALNCAVNPKVLDTRETAELPRSSVNSIVIHVGIEGPRRVSVVCGIPDHPKDAIALADVVRLSRAAVELEEARADERNRAALWPAPPIEEQAGALFLAEDMKTLLATARRIAPTTVPVLITGETGTGKEVLARTIHAYSARAKATFLPFNCSSTPKDMLDSQLFGHRKGSFTGAMDNFPGVIRAAAGGTLFLDEIGETTLDVQPKLLRFLDSSEVHPIGEAQPVKTDVRVIAATNADLDTLVAEGRFREDLFYRLNIVRLHVPPLRERRVEIPTLAHHYLQKHAQEYSKGNLRLAEETMEYLVLYRWPGNVRQLANEMRRLAALAENDAVLMPEHLSPDIAASRKTVPASERTLEPTEIVVRIDQPLSAAIQHVERAMIQHAIRLTGGHMEDTAALLGVSRKGLYLKRVRYGLEPPEGTAAGEVEKA